MSTEYTPKASKAWSLFSYANFVISAVMMAGGIYSLEASFAAKGFYAMAAIMLVSSSVSITKTIRDDEEANRVYNKIEDAKTERLLSEAAVVE